MQSFYISNKKYDKKNMKILSNYLTFYPEFESNNFNIQFAYSNGRESFFKKNNNFFSNLGVFIYKNQFNKNALKLLADEIDNGKKLESILSDNQIRGQFCLILIIKNELKIITDKLGYYPVYFYKKNDNISIANSMLLLAKNNITTINHLGIAQYLSENYRHVTYACCDQNLFKEINYLEPGTIYEIRQNSIFKNNYYDIKKHLEIGKYNSFNEITELSEEILTNNLSFLKNVEGRIHSDITGGVDTRLVISLLEKLGINFNVGVQAITEYKDFSNQGKFSELNIIDKIIKYKKLEFDIFSEEKYNLNSKLIEDITFLHSHKQTYNRRTGYFFDVRNKDTSIMISGMSGTELLRLSYLDYFKDNNELDLLSFLKRYVELVDVMHDNLLNKKEYYDHLVNFYENNLSGVKYKKAKDLSSFIDYFAFYRTHFCRYLSLANSFLPFYTPYGDHTFARFMYQVSWNQKKKFKIQRSILTKLDPKLASFYSTRGIPLSTVNLSNFYRFSNMISDNIPQQHFNFNQRISRFAYTKLIKFLFKNKKIYYSYLNKNNDKKIISKKNLWNTPDNISIIKDLDEFINSSNNLPVFELVDKKKLIHYTEKDCNYNVLNRVKNLNRILEFTSN